MNKKQIEEKKKCYICGKPITEKTQYCEIHDFGFIGKEDIITVCETCNEKIRVEQSKEPGTTSKKLFIGTTWWIIQNLKDENHGE